MAETATKGTPDAIRSDADRVREEYQSIALQELYEERIQRHRSKKEQDELRRLAGLTSQERSQLVCDEQNPKGDGMSRYRVHVEKDKTQPTLEVWAFTEDDAVGRYRRCCGILATDHEIQAVRA